MIYERIKIGQINSIVLFTLQMDSYLITVDFFEYRKYMICNLK